MTDDQQTQDNIGVILRGYNNADMGTRLRELLADDRIKHIAVMSISGEGFDKDVDGQPFTRKLIADVLEDAPDPITRAVWANRIHYTPLDKGISKFPLWATALNVGAADLIKRDVDYIMPLSNEVTFTPHLLDSLLDAAKKPHTSVAYAEFVGARPQDQALLDMLDGLLKKNGLNINTYKLPRNTCSLWPAEHLKTLHSREGYFYNPITEDKENGWGGMEDVFSAMSMLPLNGSKAEFLRPRRAVEKADIVIPQVNNVLPGDAGWDEAVAKWVGKLTAENGSMTRIHQASIEKSDDPGIASNMLGIFYEALENQGPKSETIVQEGTAATFMIEAHREGARAMHVKWASYHDQEMARAKKKTVLTAAVVGLTGAALATLVTVAALKPQRVAPPVLQPAAASASLK